MRRLPVGLAASSEVNLGFSVYHLSFVIGQVMIPRMRNILHDGALVVQVFLAVFVYARCYLVLLLLCFGFFGEIEL